MDEGQGDQFTESTGSFLQIPQAQEMARPIHRSFDMAEHDGRGTAKSEAVRGLHHFQPLVGIDLVGTQRRPDFVIEDFRRRAGQGAEPFITQHAEIRIERQAKRLCPLEDFQWREGVDVKIGQRGL